MSGWMISWSVRCFGSEPNWPSRPAAVMIALKFLGWSWVSPVAMRCAGGEMMSIEPWRHFAVRFASAPSRRVWATSSGLDISMVYMVRGRIGGEGMWGEEGSGNRGRGEEGIERKMEGEEYRGEVGEPSPRPSPIRMGEGGRGRGGGGGGGGGEKRYAEGAEV